MSPAGKALAAEAVATSRRLSTQAQSVEVVVRLTNVPPGLTKVRRFVVDATHANAFRPWVAAGGASGGKSAVAAARASMALRPEESQRREGSTERLEVHLEPNSVVLVVLSPP